MLLAVAVLATACTGPGGVTLPLAPERAVTTAPTAAPPTTTTTLALDRLRWRTVAPAPAARQEVASAVMDGKVWVVGGLNNAGAVATVESYDPATDRWETGPDLPIAVHHPAAVAYRGELVVIGGFLAAGDLYTRPTDRVFALRAGAWVELPRLRRPRGAAAAAVVADRIVLVGGRDSGLLIGPSEAFDGNAWLDRAPIPTLRDHLAADGDGTVLYAVGGRFLSPGRTSGAFERYDPVRDSWEALDPLPTPRGGLGAALLNGRLVTAGGENSSDVYPQVEAFDVASNAWTSLPPLPVPRHGVALNAVGLAVYALLGGSQYSVAPSRAAEVLG